MLKKKTKLTTVALAVPSYDTRIEWASASRALMPTQRKDVQVLNLFANSSLLAFNFNNLWTTALNYMAKHKLDYFVMMHGDIVPEIYWLDKLLAIIESTGADLLGVAIPIKDHKGLTSLALSSEDPYTPLTQITMKQLAQLPETFSAMEVCNQIGVQRLPMPWLQVNTGLMIVRMNRSYTHNLYFTINDAIRQKKDGTYQAVVESEDWFFSRLVNQYGGKVMATKAVVVDHIGPDKFNNQDVWGADWDARLLQNITSKKMDGTIWTLEEAKLLHVHSPGLAQWLVNNLDRKSFVYDLGCGKGTYLDKLDKSGFRSQGFEGTPGVREISDCVPALIEEFDITKKINVLETGHVLCFEVLEHIEPEKEWLVLQNIKSLCDGILVLSWAIEGQNGHGHINCRNADYVVPTIEKLGFRIDFLATMHAREAAVSNNGPQFFYNSLYVFRKV